MKLSEIEFTLFKIVGDSTTENENVGDDIDKASFAMVEIEQNGDEVTKGQATKFKQELEFRGNVVASKSEKYWLIYRYPSKITLASLGR